MNRVGELEKKYVCEVLENQFESSKNSIFTTRLESGFASMFGAKYAINCVNGTATLHTALVACGIGEGDEVIVPPLTMSSPAISVLQANAVPVFADVDLDTFQISAKSIEQVITKKTKAIMTVALYGLAPDYDAITAICEKHNLFLIEDNAECFLGEYKGKLVGQFGDFASYSFQATKHMTSGEGGMLTTNNEQMADRARKFTSLGYAGVSSKQGKITKLDIQDPGCIRHVTLGFNYRMSELCSAVALAQLERLEELVQCRIDAAVIFDEIFTESLIFTPQAKPEGYKNSYWAYSVYLKEIIPAESWHKFKKIYLANGGEGFYAAWLLSYEETLFLDYAKTGKSWQKFEKGLCPIAEFLQPRMLQFKTDFWTREKAEREAAVIAKSIEEFELVI